MDIPPSHASAARLYGPEFAVDPAAAYERIREGHAILSALAREVARFEAGQPERRLNQVVRGLFALPTTITASGVS